MWLDKNVMSAALLLLVAFVVIWIAADVAIRSVEKVASRLHLSRFTISLFVLGAATSFPEITVTINSLLLNTPQIAIGTLLGGQLFLLFLIIPFFALISKGIQLKSQISNTSLAITLIVALVPMVAFIDQSFSLAEALMTFVVYALFVLTFAKHDNVAERLLNKVKIYKADRVGVELIKILGAGAVLFLATNTAVRSMVELSALLNLPRFLVSFLLLPIGTNLPELALGIKSAFGGRKDLALGDYMGSMTFNSLLLVILAVASSGPLLLGQDVTLMAGLFVVGLIVFWLCCRSNKFLSMAESLLLLLFYISFVSLAWVQGFANSL